MKPGDKVFCPRCKAHYVTAITEVHAGDVRSGRPFVYADGKPVNDMDEMKCRNCGADMLDELQLQFSAAHQ